MPIRPVDLSTMFMRLTELSKEQAIMQDATARQQALQDANMKKKALEDANKVHSLEELQEGPEKVQDEANENQTDGHKSSDGTKKETTETKPEEKKVIKVTDPLLGNSIDISG